MLTGRTHRGTKLSSLVGLKKKPESNWIVVAHQHGASIVKWVDGSPMKIVEKLKSKKGKGTVTRRSRVPKHTPQTLASEEFASSIADFLKSGRIAKSYSHLILIAEPRFLGLLQSSLDTQTKRLLSKTEEKDFAHLTGNTLLKKLNSVCAAAKIS